MATNKDTRVYASDFGAYNAIWRAASLPITNLLLKTSVTPNQVTVFNILLTFAIGYSFFLQTVQTVAAGIVFLYLSMVLDRVDGQIARAKNMTSKRGQFLDGIYSYFLDTMIVVPLGAGLFAKTGNILFLVLGFATALFYMYTHISSRERGLLIGGQLGAKLVRATVKVEPFFKTLVALPNRHIKEILVAALLLEKLDLFMIAYFIYSVVFWFGYVLVLSVFPEEKK